jgi:hypothetical protein
MGASQACESNGACTPTSTSFGEIAFLQLHHGKECKLCRVLLIVLETKSAIFDTSRNCI